MPKHGRILRGSCEYDYDHTASTKAVPQKLFGASHVSTTSVNGELVDGVKNQDVKSMFA